VRSERKIPWPRQFQLFDETTDVREGGPLAVARWAWMLVTETCVRMGIGRASAGTPASLRLRYSES
jgi:hypothetical protein